MKRRIKEETIIFLSILKWLILASIIGVIVGAAVTVFLKLLTISTSLTAQHSYYFLLLPLAFFLSALIVKLLAPDAEGHGTEKVIEAVHKHSGKINVMVVPVKLVSTLISIAFGGSAGKEGPCAQIGGGLASLFADMLRFSDADRKKLVICGISGGFASVFGTPIAGALFGIEVLFVGSILYDVLLPSFVAGIISYQVSSHFGITYFYHPINFVPLFSESFFLKMVVAGIFFGFCSFLFIETFLLVKKFSSGIKLSKPLKGIIGGAVLVILTFLFSKQYLGLGLETIESSLVHGEATPWYGFFIKAVFTSVTLNFGGSGGILTPIFFSGATAGAMFSKVLGVDATMLAAIGMVSMAAGACNTPIAASVMAIELFGAQVAPYAAIACVFSFIITGHRSVYPSQVLAIKKSASIDIELGKELHEISPKYLSKEGSLIGALLRILKKPGNR